MSEAVFGILTACVLYFVYFFLSKIIQKYKRKAAPVKLSPRRWVRRWGFACNWLAVSAFIWMAMLSFLSFDNDVLSNYVRQAKSALRELSEAQKAYKEKYGRYAQSFKELEWSPSGRYFFYMGDDLLYMGMDIDLLYEDRRERTIRQLPSGLHASVSKERFTAFAVSDLDGDEEKDIWRITGPSGSIEHVYDDLKQKPVDAAIAAFAVTALCLAVISFILNLKQNKKLQQAESDKIKQQQTGIQSQKE